MTKTEIKEYNLKDTIPWDVGLILDRFTECRSCSSFTYKLNKRTNKWYCVCCGKRGDK